MQVGVTILGRVVPTRARQTKQRVHADGGGGGKAVDVDGEVKGSEDGAKKRA